MNHTIEGIYIEKIIYKGLGLGRLKNGKRIMVQGNPIPQSTVNVEVIKKKKDFLIGKLLKTTKYSEDMTNKTVPCPHYKNPLDHESGSCGGCKRQILPYAEQLKIKENILFDSFRQQPDTLYAAQILPIKSAPTQYHYRNKVEHSFGQSTKSDRQLGFHASGSFQQIVDVDQCFLVTQKAHHIFSQLKQLFKESGLPTYKQIDHTGILRHCIMREGINTGQILINLVYAEKNLDQVEQEKRDQLLAKLSSEAKRRQQITTFLITQNNGLGDTVSPALPTSILRGKGYIYESLTRIQKQQKEINNKTIVIEEGTIKEKDNKTKTDKDTNKDITCTFKISPLSFFQTNTHGAESMIDIIIEFLGNHEAKTLLDLYCGTGSLGISLLKNSIGQKLIGIEILPEAIEDARHNAQINDIEDKVYFNAGKAEVLIYKDEHIQQQLQDINTIIVDPPRSGLHKKVISFLNKLKQTHDFVLAYISCNPVTLARDCEKLTKNEFKLQKIQALDMFPQTYHVETIALLK